ncbi:MAG: glycosyltransferase family 2 protein [Hyphomicrobiales bacterium]
MSTTLVSVVVPTRDRPALLDEALASIRRLEGDDLSFEILVGDNGNDPLTPEVCERHGARRIPVGRPGAAAARNAAMREASARYIAFLDDDDVWLPGHIRPHLALLSANPGLGGAVGQVANAAPDLSSHGPFFPERLPSHGDLFGAFLKEYPQIGGTVVRASVRDSVGYFDEELLNDQDWDWHLRLALTHGVGFVEVPCVLFRQRAAGTSDALQWQRIRFCRKVFLRNVLRAGSQRPSPLFLARTFLAHNGSYVAYFGDSAWEHLQAGDRRGSAGAIGRAFLASPPHALAYLVRDTPLRRSAVRLMTGHSRPRPKAAA